MVIGNKDLKGVKGRRSIRGCTFCKVARCNLLAIFYVTCSLTLVHASTISRG